MDRAILLMILSVPALVAGPADVADFASPRLEVVTPPNENLYQSFSLSLPRYTVRTTIFLFTTNREIAFYTFDTISGTGTTTIVAGGRGFNSMTVRAESGARAFSFVLRIQTAEKLTTTTTSTTTSTTTTTTTTETSTSTTETPTSTTETPTLTTVSSSEGTTATSTTSSSSSTPPDSLDPDSDDSANGSASTPTTTVSVEIPSTTCYCTCD